MKKPSLIAMKKSKFIPLTLVVLLSGLAGFYTPKFIEARAKEMPSTNDVARMQAMTMYGDSSTTMAFNWNTTYYNDSDLQICPKSLPFTDKNAIEFKGTVEKSKALNDDFIHRVIATGLTPDTEYQYRFGDKELGVWCKTGSFKTSSQDRADFDFVHISDPQGWQEAHYAEYNKLLSVMNSKIKPDFIALTGDIVNNSFETPALNQWEMALTDQFSILRNYPVAPVAGNHETAPYDFSSRFTLNAPETSTGETGDYYSFDYEGVHFIGLNTNDTHGSDDPSKATGLSQEQVDWLEDQLKNSQDARMRIVLMHKGIFDSGTHSNNMGDMQDYDIKYIREQCAPLFTKYNVNLVLQGHDHLFSLSEPTIAKYENNTYSYEVDESCTVENKMYDGEEIPTYSDLQGTFYLNSGTASGSKYYVPVPQTIPEIKIKITENPGAKMISHLSVEGNTIIVRVYSQAGKSLKPMYKFAIEAKQNVSPVNPSNINQTVIIVVSVVGGVVALGMIAAIVMLIIKRKKRV